MKRELAAVRHELDRIGCAVRYCGPYGLIFAEDGAGGLKMHQKGIHYWTDKDKAILDPKEVLHCLSELPPQSGEEAARRVLSSLAWRE
jgi:hypothetical protein